jgi:anti-anti-sigma factor
MDTAGVEKNETRFFALFAPKGVDTVFDLTKVTLLTSMGLRILISGAKTAAARGFQTVIVAPPGPVRDVLDHAAIHELMPVVADGASATSRLRSARKPGG